MKLVTYETKTPVGTVRRVGALRGNDAEVVDLNFAYQWLARERGGPRPIEEANFFVPTDMIEFLRGGDQTMHAAREALAAIKGSSTAPNGAAIVLPRPQVKLLAPVPTPLSIHDFTTWEMHMSKRLRRSKSWYTNPSAYKGLPASVVGPEDSIFWPYYSEKMDLEAELGFYVGKEGRDLTIEEASDHIAGYTIFIDPSARDVERQSAMSPFKGKDYSYMMGPCIVTPDEFDEKLHRKAYGKVNGELWWELDISVKRQFWSPNLLAYVSDTCTVLPGDFIAAGTFGGSGSYEINKWIKPGDHYELGVEGIGVIKTQVIKSPGVVHWVRDGVPGNMPVPQEGGNAARSETGR